MKKIFCILAGAALLGACGQKTDVVVPAASPAPEKPDMAAMGAKPSRNTGLTAVATPAASTEKAIEDAAAAAKKEIDAAASAVEKKIDAAAAAVTTETKTESSDTGNISMSTPNP